MSIPLTRPLVVPEFTTGLVKLYVPHPVTGETVVLRPYTLDMQRLVDTLFPGEGRTARPNSCALHGTDLFVSNSSPTSQCIFKVPNYLVDGAAALAQAFVFTLDGMDYVGLAFDAQGHLYATEGSFNDNRIIRYTRTDVPYPGTLAQAKQNNYGTDPGDRTDLGNAAATSYFANLAFDAADNLWASDYRNHRLVAFDAATLGGTNTHHVLPNLNTVLPVSTTDPALGAATDHLFAEPEGLDFDAAGNLWVANNNDGTNGVKTTRTSIVQIPPALQTAVLATTAGTELPAEGFGTSGTDFFIYQVPDPVDDTAPTPPQFGGLQIDRTAGRLFVSEQIAGNGRGYDIASIASIGTTTAPNDLEITTTNPGNGGISLTQTPLTVFLIET